MKGREEKKIEMQRQEEKRMGEKKRGGCYCEGSGGGKVRRSADVFQIYVSYKDVHFAIGVKIELRSRHPPPT